LRLIIPRDRIQQYAPIISFCPAPLTGWYATFATDTSSGTAVTVMPQAASRITSGWLRAIIVSSKR